MDTLTDLNVNRRIPSPRFSTLASTPIGTDLGIISQCMAMASRTRPPEGVQHLQKSKKDISAGLNVIPPPYISLVPSQKGRRTSTKNNPKTLAVKISNILNMNILILETNLYLLWGWLKIQSQSFLCILYPSIFSLTKQGGKS